MANESKMQGASSNSYFRKIAIVLFLVGMLLITSAFSALTANVNISTSGTILVPGPEVTAASGSVQDIQAAVDAVSAVGGGTVRIPAGNWTFNMMNPNAKGSFTSSQRYGVVVPGGVNVTGAGIDQTILYCPLTGWASGDPASTAYGNTMFCLDGRNGRPIRISGMTLHGTVYMAPGATDGGLELTGPQLTGISAFGVTDGRIDHIETIDFSRAGIMATHNYVQYANPDGNCGVIDHCIIDNPYKSIFKSLTGNDPLWAYGIIISGAYPLDWDPDWTNWFGQYHHDIWFIEDSEFHRCRHMVAGGSLSYAYYVLRHCYMENMILQGYGSYQDVHGGGEGCEAYQNVIQNVGGDGIGLYSRGGFALYWGNEIRDFYRYGSAITLANDQSLWDYARLNGVWIWDNTYVNCKTEVNTNPNAYPIVENQEYFLRAPNQTQDGFTYTPYPYPHPLTQNP